jgi:glycosyltransferase involved in cell wall biosynthesis
MDNNKIGLNDPLVSILIPCFNVDKYVEKAVTSILLQTYKNLEIWLINDGSTDNTLKILESFIDERIKIMHFEQNTKKIGAVNEVLKKVKGDFIAFQDADDWSETNRIEKQLKEFRKDKDLGICFTGYKYTGFKSNFPGPIALTNADLKDEFLHFGHKQNKRLDVTVCATMFISKKVLEETGGYHSYFKDRVGEDIFWVSRILKNFNGCCINETLYYYNQREGSSTSRQINGDNIKAAYSWELLEKMIYKANSENINLLEENQAANLRAVELEACEDALKKQIINVARTTEIYKNSNSFKLGNKLLNLVRIFRK